MPDTPLPEGALIKAEAEVRLPCAATHEQVEEWLGFHFGGSGSMEASNPLDGYEPEAFGCSGVTLTDTGMRGRHEDFDHQEVRGVRTYRRQFFREVR